MRVLWIVYLPIKRILLALVKPGGGLCPRNQQTGEMG